MHLWYVDWYSDLSPDPFETVRIFRVLMARQVLEKFTILIYNVSTGLGKVTHFLDNN